MNRWVCFVLLLFAHLMHGKPLKKSILAPGELGSEKRHELVEEDETATNELQRFMLDLSTKEDMNRLHERFRKVDATRDVENDQEYRRLKRFSLSDEESDGSSTGGGDTMEHRSSRTMREDQDKTSFERYITVVVVWDRMVDRLKVDG